MSKTEHEILSITQEECAEVIQAISKCFRFGIDGVKPGLSETNREHLAEELGDLQAMIELCIAHNIVTEDQLTKAAANKLIKLQQWSAIF